MKKIFSFIVIIALMLSGVFAQELSPEVISTAGDFSESATGSISWTIGEIAVESFTTAEGSLLQGFQQPGYSVETFIENNEFNISVQVYPVPASDFISVKINESQNDLELVLYDLQGKIVLRQQAKQDKTDLDLSHLSSSEYILNVVDQENNLIKSYKIIKY